MASFKQLEGKILKEILISEYRNEITFVCSDGVRFIMEHYQCCCEDVYLDEINGDITDILGTPIIIARESTNNKDPRDPDDESFTWTFYDIQTKKGHVQLKWYGSSNGWYSEDVDFYKIKN